MPSTSLVDPLATKPEPLWLRSLEEAITRTEAGLPILPSGVSLTSDQRNFLTTQAKGLREYLMPKPGDEQHTGAALFGLFSTFPSQNVSDAVMQAKMAMYLDVLTQFPAWAAKKAVRFWMAAEHSEAGDNHAFPPSPPQLARLARLAMRDVYQQIHRFETMAAAKPAVPDPTPEQKARADALVASFRWNTMKGEVA